MTDRLALTADQLADEGLPLHSARRRIADWRRAGWPRTYQRRRLDASGRPVGGVQWVVDAGDYRDLLDGRVPAEGVAQAA